MPAATLLLGLTSSTTAFLFMLLLLKRGRNLVTLHHRLPYFINDSNMIFVSMLGLWGPSLPSIYTDSFRYMIFGVFFT